MDSANSQGTGIKYSGSYGTQVSVQEPNNSYCPPVPLCLVISLLHSLSCSGTSLCKDSHKPYTCNSTTRMAQTTPVVMAHGIKVQVSVGFKSKGYAILGIQFNAIATQ